MVVFRHNRVSSIVAVYAGRDVPPKLVGALELTCRTEFHQMTLRPVVAGIGAEDDAPVRRYGRRGRAIIENTPRPRLVRSRIDAEVRALSAAAWSADRQQHSAAVVQT